MGSSQSSNQNNDEEISNAAAEIARTSLREEMMETIANGESFRLGELLEAAISAAGGPGEFQDDLLPISSAAINSGNLDTVTAIVNSGVWVEATDELKYALLSRGIAHKDADIVEQLLRIPGVSEQVGVSVVKTVIQNRSHRMLKLIMPHMEMTADNVKEVTSHAIEFESRNNPLFKAYLLEINWSDFVGTPLLADLLRYAINFGNIKILSNLLTVPQFSQLLVRGETWPFHIAISNENSRIYDVLIREYKAILARIDSGEEDDTDYDIVVPPRFPGRSDGRPNVNRRLDFSDVESGDVENVEAANNAAVVEEGGDIDRLRALLRDERIEDSEFSEELFANATALLTSGDFPFDELLSMSKAEGVHRIRVGDEGNALVTLVHEDKVFPVMGRYYFVAPKDPTQYLSIKPDGSGKRREDARRVLQAAKQQFLVWSAGPKQSPSQKQVMRLAKQRLLSMLEQHFGRSTPQLLRLLGETRSIIAGSFVMQAILREDWPTSDIDVWMPYVDPADKRCTSDSPFLRLQQFLREGGYTREYSTWSPTKLPEAYQRLRMIGAMIIFNDGTGRNRPPVQLLVTRPDVNILDMISTFDITACQALFLRGKVRMAPPYYLDLVERVVKLSPGASNQTLYEWVRTGKRILKYVKRGFTVDPDVWDTIQETMVAELARIGGITYSWRHNDMRVFMSIVQAWNAIDLGGSTLPAFLFLPPVYFAVLHAGEGGTYEVLWDNATNEHDARELRPALDEQAEASAFPVPDTCYDVEEADYEDISSAAGQQQLVVLDPAGKNAVCFGREMLVRKLLDPKQQMLECLSTEGSSGYWPRMDTPSRTYFLVLSHSSGSFYVSQFDVIRALLSGERLFKLQSVRKLERTGGRHSLEEQDYVSADHCQEGSDKMLYELVVVSSAAADARPPFSSRFTRTPPIATPNASANMSISDMVRRLREDGYYDGNHQSRRRDDVITAYCSHYDC